MPPLDPAPLLLSLRLAAVTTAILLVLGTPLAWWLARGRGRLLVVLDAAVALPVVLPPTVLGFYLLVLLGPRGAVGAPWEALGGPRLVFSFTGLVIGSCIYSLPFVVQPLKTAFRGLGDRPLEEAASLGAGPLDRFLTVAVPMGRSAFATAATLGFAHTLGEFGVVLMLGGDVPGRTDVVSVAIFDHVERLEYGAAHAQAALLLLVSFAVLLFVHVLDRRARRGLGA